MPASAEPVSTASARSTSSRLVAASAPPRPEGEPCGFLGERAERIAAHEPAAVLGDADGQGVEARAVDGGHDRGGAGEGDFVLARAAAEDDADAELLRHAFLSKLGSGFRS